MCRADGNVEPSALTWQPKGLAKGLGGVSGQRHSARISAPAEETNDGAVKVMSQHDLKVMFPFVLSSCSVAPLILIVAVVAPASPVHLVSDALRSANSLCPPIPVVWMPPPSGPFTVIE